MQIESEGERPLRVWIAGFDRAQSVAAEWPGEHGLGPRVLRVEYLADGKLMATVLGDPEHPAEQQRFVCEQRLLERGHHRLAARVIVQLPPAEKADFRRFLDKLGYTYVDESANPAYRMFLGR